MTRIACLVAVVAVAATNGAMAAERHSHSHSSSPANRHHSSPVVAVPAVSRPAVLYPVVAGYAPSYSSYSSHQPLTFARTSAPNLLYVSAVSPAAPPFSFNGSEPLPGWNWQRVSLQQIDAEVRAKRVASPAAAPAFRKYCPDSRAYYPEVTRCGSDWLTVVSR